MFGVVVVLFAAGCGDGGDGDAGDTGDGDDTEETNGPVGNGDEAAFCTTLAELNDLDEPDTSDVEVFQTYFQELTDLATSLPENAPPDLREDSQELADFAEDINAEVQSAESSDELAGIEEQFESVDTGISEAGERLDQYSSDECAAASDTGT